MEGNLFRRRPKEATVENKRRHIASTKTTNLKKGIVITK